MELNEKIKQILVDKNVSPSHFADEIGVQRSSISHILAGRNRPSLDIIQKIVKRYPDIGLDWILDDEEETVYSGGPSALKSEIYEPKYPQNRPHTRGLESRRESLPAPSTNQTNLRAQPESPVRPEIERILIFYSDGTFKEYKSS
ncbi:helix-turn-helix transcriptional regulator [Rhabdobacter roseus]|uniref:Transcriptional regulator with XRE-family HTH domain n=1 Tax=Rhabdobacter roseus TaxID=1655419 RepID=A0A840TI69_9BACT|nr:helix-turn-helix transcriptional regulator [Rhabdobacter roseus]MBB5283164.1 transcriptional regulator with XRE-family HTH domain [Rhabdobacter roseus]